MFTVFGPPIKDSLEFWFVGRRGLFDVPLTADPNQEEVSRNRFYSHNF